MQILSFKYFSHFPQKTGFDISCKGDNLHEMSNPIFWEKEEQYINLSSAELAKRVVKVYTWVHTVLSYVQ